MTDLETIRWHQDGAVGTVSLDRPERHHAFDATMRAEPSALWRRLRTDDSVRVVVLTATGTVAFCTGIDRAEIPSDGDGAFSPYAYDDPGSELGPKSCGLWKPVIAAVNGMACGGAFYLLGRVEFVIAADHATFFDPHVSYGMPAVYEPALLLRRMPFAEVMRLALLGNHERLSAERAHAMGLVSEVVPAAELADRARWAAGALATSPTAAVQATVRALWAAREVGPGQALDLAPALLNLGLSPASLAEGEEQFRSGRRTEWRLR